MKEVEYARLLVDEVKLLARMNVNFKKEVECAW